MKTEKFINLVRVMNSTQRSVLKELAGKHSDLMWDGGKVDTCPRRVPIKNMSEKSMAAINTREKECFLRLEFRSRDYDGPNVMPTKHPNFDRFYDFYNTSDIDEASKIISIIKQNYR